jgi:hypothetical protein
MPDNPKTVEATIKRLTREIAQIDQVFYRTNENGDRSLYAGMLERKRDDMIRAAVLQMHTAIEDVLNSYIICRILNAKPETRVRAIRSTQGQALRKMLFGAGSLGFDMKLNLAVALRLITPKTKDRLMTLNTLRNKCSHNWLLKTPVRRGKRPAQKKPPLLLYEGRDLHNVVVLKDFLAEYGPLYYRLFLKYLG